MHSVKIKDESTRKLEKIYEIYKNRMYIAACRVLNDPLLAEDAVHDTFIALSRNTEKIKDINSVSTASYVIKAAKNTALNMVKKNSRESLLPFDRDINEEADDSMLDRVCERESVESIVRAILSLSEKYRDVLSLYYLNECTVSQIADILGRKETTVKQQLSRGRKKLIDIIEKGDDSNEKQ